MLFILNTTMKTRIRVCIHETCCQRGSEKVYDALKRAFPTDESDIDTTEHCFRFCKSGPNVAVNGAVLHHVTSDSAVRMVHKSLSTRTVKKEAVGMRSLDELEDALDELTKL